MPEAPNEDKVMTFWEHTEELAKRLRVILYTLFASTVAIMVLPADPSFLRNPLEFYVPLIALILKAVREQILPPNVRLIGLELVAPIELYVVASFILGVAVTIPVIAYEIYRFVDPALRPQERRGVYPFLLYFSALFIFGLFFGYKVITPVLVGATFPFFYAIGAEPIVSILEFYNVVFITTLVTGLAFTFPTILVILVKYGVIGTDMLTKNRRYLYAGWFIATAVLTPDGGPVADLILFAPTVALMETGLLIARRYEKNRQPVLVEIRPTCRFCGAPIPSSSGFCPKCGKAQR